MSASDPQGGPPIIDVGPLKKQNAVTRVNIEEWGKLLKNVAHLCSSSRIILVSCHTGRNPSSKGPSLGQLLSDATGSTVLAPSGSADGDLHSDEITTVGGMITTTPTPWREFSPGSKDSRDLPPIMRQ